MVPEQIEIETAVTAENFDEEGYLASNPDVAAAVRAGQIPSAREHFTAFGCREVRKISQLGLVRKARMAKLQRLRPLLRKELESTESPDFISYLTEARRREFKIVETDNISAHPYDEHALRIIREHAEGLVLDCGAGKRSTYYANVVNYEIVPYPSTDVLGIAEELPFQDESFDAVLCLAVLEHVKDPFRSAREISRVLKKNGVLYCAVPFLQPLHAYPHHYYNMTHQGLRNLFEEQMEVERLFVHENTGPIWSLCWILQSWADGLSGAAKRKFLSLRVQDLIGDAGRFLEEPFVRGLSEEKRFELASGNCLLARKR